MYSHVLPHSKQTTHTQTRKKNLQHHVQNRNIITDNWFKNNVFFPMIFTKQKLYYGTEGQLIIQQTYIELIFCSGSGDENEYYKILPSSCTEPI